jgi:hypothetical protein
MSDVSSIEAACKELVWDYLGLGTHRVTGIEAQQVTGVGIKLGGYYTSVIDTTTGEVYFDGDVISHLDKLKQQYQVESIKRVAMLSGDTVTVVAMPDGRIEVSLQHRPTLGAVVLSAPRTTKFEITNDGDCRLESTGFSGSSCQLATAAYVTALGAVTSNQATQERVNGLESVSQS